MNYPDGMNHAVLDGQSASSIADSANKDYWRKIKFFMDSLAKEMDDGMAWKENKQMSELQDMLGNCSYYIERNLV